MNIRTISITALLAGAVAAPALAGGFATPAPAPFVPAPAPVVVAQPELTWTGPSVGLRLGYGGAEADTGGATLDDDGFLYGLQAAYDYDFGNVVAGVVVSADKLNIDLDPGVDVDGVARLGGRLGFDSGRNWYYATAGYAKLFTDGGGVGDSDGYFAGLGYEVRLTETLSAGAEVLYHEFDDFDAAGVDADATTANLSLNLRF